MRLDALDLFRKRPGRNDYPVDFEHFTVIEMNLDRIQGVFDFERTLPDVFPLIFLYGFEIASAQGLWIDYMTGLVEQQAPGERNFKIGFEIVDFCAIEFVELNPVVTA